MEVNIPKISKSKTTYLSVISLIMSVWAYQCYKQGALIYLDWPLVVVVGLMVVGRSVQIIIGGAESI